MEKNSVNRRIASIDILRGLVIVIMLIDHVRERFYLHKQVLDPMDINSTDPELFFTRMLAHLCAPIFVFLTGLSAWLYANPANRPPRSAFSFLFKRGLILILLEATLINFSWFAAYTTLYLQVIWAIGISMIALACLHLLPRVWIIALGVLIVFGHNLLTPVQFIPGEWGYSLWTILHDRGYLITDGIVKVKASYPVLPWIGVILLGYASAPLFSARFSVQQRTKTLYLGGIGCLLLLVILRGFNIYGESQLWSIQESFILTLMDFLNYTKYPPSLAFLLLTLGLGAILLAKLELVKNKLTDVLETFGSVPMFFYILHLYVLLLSYWILSNIFEPTIPIGPNNFMYLGYPHIGYVWLTSVVLTFILYYPCKAFSRFKRNTTMGWVKYF